MVIVSKIQDTCEFFQENIIINHDVYKSLETIGNISISSELSESEACE